MKRIGIKLAKMLGKGLLVGLMVGLGAILGLALWGIGPSGVYYIPKYLGVPLPHLRAFDYGGLYYVSEYEDAYIFQKRDMRVRIEWRAGWHWAYPLWDNVYIFPTPEREPSFYALLDEVRLWDEYYDAVKEGTIPLASDAELWAMAEEIYPKFVAMGLVEKAEDIHEPSIRFVMFAKRERYLYAGVYAWYSDRGIIDEKEEPMSDVVDINRYYKAGGKWADKPGIAEILAHELSHAQGVMGAWWESWNTLIGIEVAATEMEKAQWAGGVFASLRAMSRDTAYWMMNYGFMPPKNFPDYRQVWLYLEKKSGALYELPPQIEEDPFLGRINAILQGREGWRLAKEEEVLKANMPSWLSGDYKWGPTVHGYTLVYQTKKWEKAFDQLILDTYDTNWELQRYREHMSHLKDEGWARMMQMQLEYEVYPYFLLSSSLRMNEPLWVILIEGRTENPDDAEKWTLRVAEIDLDDLTKVVGQYIERSKEARE